MRSKELSSLSSESHSGCFMFIGINHSTCFLGMSLCLYQPLYSFLCYQIMTGHEECVQMLLEKDVSILCRDARGRTPLHFAAARGHATWLSELLQVALSEEDCSLKDNQGYTPLHWACYNGKFVPVDFYQIQMQPQF